MLGSVKEVSPEPAGVYSKLAPKQQNAAEQTYSRLAPKQQTPEQAYSRLAPKQDEPCSRLAPKQQTDAKAAPAIHKGYSKLSPLRHQKGEASQTKGRALCEEPDGVYSKLAPVELTAQRDTVSFSNPQSRVSVADSGFGEHALHSVNLVSFACQIASGMVRTVFV